MSLRRSFGGRSGEDSPPLARIAILLPMVWSVRNVVHSGLLQRLREQGIEPHLILKKLPGASESIPGLEAAASIRPLLTARASGSEMGRSFLGGVLLYAYALRNRIRSIEIYSRWYRRRERWAAVLRIRLSWLLARVAALEPVYQGLASLWKRLYRRCHDLDSITEQLRAIAPDMLWSTVCVSATEYPYIVAAKELGIGCVTSILSFDNMSSRFHRPDYDHYLVWSEAMAQQVRRFLPAIQPAQISVTGTPQFDFHRRPDLVRPRPELLEWIGLPQGARYFLYASSHHSLAPDEPRLVAQLVQRVRTDPALRSYWLVVRLHPLDNWERWSHVSQSSCTLCSKAWTTAPDAEGWTFSSVEDQSRLVNTLIHAEACINIASTMSLDAAIMDTPVVGIDFSNEPDSPRDILYEEYEADHYKPLVDSGGIRLATSWEGLIELMRRCADHRSEGSSARAGMVLRECGKLDGKGAERVAIVISDLAREYARENGREIPECSALSCGVQSAARPSA